MGVGASVVRNPPSLLSLERRFLEVVELDDESDDDRRAAVYDRYRRRSRGRPPRVPCVYVPAGGRQISINFSSDGNDTGQRGFAARFRVFRGM